MVEDSEPLRLLAELVGAELVVGGGDFRDQLPGHPGEVPLEMREQVFLAARSAATDAALRKLLVRAGLEPVAVPRSSDGFRLWPQGVVGSVSHKRTAIIAVLAPSGSIRGIGVDVEYDDGADLSAIPGLIGSDELGLTFERNSTAWLLAFSAKESAYKAIYPSMRSPLGYEDILLRWAGEFRTLTAVAHVGGRHMVVRAVVKHPWVVTVALWR